MIVPNKDDDDPPNFTFLIKSHLVVSLRVPNNQTSSFSNGLLKVLICLLWASVQTGIGNEMTVL